MLKSGGAKVEASLLLVEGQSHAAILFAFSFDEEFDHQISEGQSWNLLFQGLPTC